MTCIIFGSSCNSRNSAVQRDATSTLFGIWPLPCFLRHERAICTQPSPTFDEGNTLPRHFRTSHVYVTCPSAALARTVDNSRQRASQSPPSKSLHLNSDLPRTSKRPPPRARPQPDAPTVHLLQPILADRTRDGTTTANPSPYSPATAKAAHPQDHRARLSILLRLAPIRFSANSRRQLLVSHVATASNSLRRANKDQARPQIAPGHARRRRSSIPAAPRATKLHPTSPDAGPQRWSRQDQDQEALADRQRRR